MCVCVCVCVCELLSYVWLFVTPWAVDHQAPLFTEFSKQEYWSGYIYLKYLDNWIKGVKGQADCLLGDQCIVNTLKRISISEE